MRHCFFIIFSVFSICSIAQSKKELKSICIYKSIDKIIIDGELNESSWDSAEVAGNFRQIFPFDTSDAKSQTMVRVTFDDNNLFISAVCFDSIAGKHIVQSLKRDFSYPINDAFAVYLGEKLLVFFNRLFAEAIAQRLGNLGMVVGHFAAASGCPALRDAFAC